MSEAPAFADKWGFLLGHALMAVSPDRTQMFSLRGADGRPRLALWTREDLASAGAPEGWTLYRTDVASRLRELPEGVGMVVDSGTPGGLELDPEYAASLKPLTEVFPVGSRSEFKVWPLLPREVRAALAEQAGRYEFVEAVWALLYRVDDSPWMGLLVYQVQPGPEAQESVADALVAALDASATLPELGVPIVRVVAESDLAPPVREALAEQDTVLDRRSATA
jgi:hypothetical protein